MAVKMKQSNDLTQGNIKSKLLRFALPFLAANFLQALYGGADLFVVGRFNGASAISAVNIGSQIMQIITSFIIGCSMGSTVLIGNCIGQKNDEKAGKALGTTILLFLFFAAILTPVMAVCSPHITELMNTPVEASAEAVSYVFICSLGIPFIIAYNVSAAVLRGMGDSKTPMMIVVIACAVNIAGDFFLTGFLGMGVTGVAIATSAAQFISSVCGIRMIRRHGLPFSFGKKQIRIGGRPLKNILFVGLPIALQDTLMNISFIIITVIANGRSLIASSAVGVVEKVIMFMFLVPSAMLSSISAVTAQNVGAGKPERAIEARNFGIIAAVAFGALMCGISWICPQIFTGIFSKDAAVITEANEYIKTYSIDCILVGFTFGFNGYLNGISKSFITFVHNVIAIFLVRIPAAWLLSRAFPDSMLPMGLASPLGSLTSIVILVIYFQVILKGKNFASAANGSRF